MQQDAVLRVKLLKSFSLDTEVDVILVAVHLCADEVEILLIPDGIIDMIYKIPICKLAINYNLTPSCKLAQEQDESNCFLHDD